MKFIYFLNVIQGIADIETRVAVMECTLSDIQNSEHSEKQESNVERHC